MGRELQIRLVNITKRRGGATRKEGSDPECVRVAQSHRAERMNVDSDCAGQKMEVRLCKRPGCFLRPPSVIKRAIGHWIAIRKKRRRIVIDYWHANFVELHRNFAEPLVTNDITGRSLVRAI